MGRVALDFFSKIRNEYVEIVRAADIRVTPNRSEQFPMRNNSAALQNQIPEKFRLFRCEVDGLLADADLAFSPIQFDVAGR